VETQRPCKSYKSMSVNLELRMSVPPTTMSTFPKYGSFEVNGLSYVLTCASTSVASACVLRIRQRMPCYFGIERALLNSK